jgi:CBS domain containing-hemolysin-like protein
LVCGFLLVSLNCFFSVSLRISPNGAFHNLILSKSLLTLSFSICFSSSTTLFVSFSILFPSSIMISTSYSVANCFNISVSSFRGRFFSITTCYILPHLSHLSISHHLHPYVLD